MTPNTLHRMSVAMMLGKSPIRLVPMPKTKYPMKYSAFKPMYGRRKRCTSERERGDKHHRSAVTEAIHHHCVMSSNVCVLKAL